MCTVDVILIADVMRRSIYENNNNNTVRRRLFSDERPSVREISERLRKSQEEINRDVTKKWNFDFQTGTPLPGRFQWIRVGGPTSSSSSSGNAPVPQTTVVVAEVVADSKRASSGLQKSGDRSIVLTQPKITDFMSSKKRHRTGDAMLSPKSKIRRLNNGKASSPSEANNSNEADETTTNTTNSSTT